MDCPACGKHNPEEHRFCWNCGMRLKAAPKDGSLGQVRPRESMVAPLDEERAKERKRLEEAKRSLLVRGIVVGILVAGAIGAFVGAVTGLMPAMRTGPAAALSRNAYAVLSAITSALQGAVAGGIVGAAVATLGGGADTGWRAGALVNAVAYIALFIFSLMGMAGPIALMGTGGFPWSYAVLGLAIWAAWGGVYGWLIGAFVESVLDRW